MKPPCSENYGGFRNPYTANRLGEYAHKCTVPIVIAQPTRAEQQALIRSLARVRLRRFRAAVGGADRAAVELYLLDAQVASHLHATVRLVEIALREHIHRALTAEFGPRWFDTHTQLFDEVFMAGLSEAKAKVGDAAPDGKIVAQLMLGTWVSLLGRGDRKADGSRARYARDLWEPAVQFAFTETTRSEANRLALRLNWARNRINHCEPVIFGFPQPGQGTRGMQVRRSPQLVLEDGRNLTRRLDPDLGSWLDRWSEIDELLAQPLVERALDLVDRDPSVLLER